MSRPAATRFLRRHTVSLWLLLSLHSVQGFLDGVSKEFSWQSVVPSDELVWHECYSNHECARLMVPLDYANPDKSSAAIALRRIHSVVSHESDEYRGPILVNPGGPGASGVDFMGYLSLHAPLVVLRDASRAEFILVERGMLVGRFAGERDEGSLRFMNTEYTARDMLHIVKAYGRERIQYWGFSYGSVLGATFAAMFPDRVDRLVIDGVLDAEDYYAGEWSNNLIDTDKVWLAFLNTCVAAGPTRCPVYALTAVEIQTTVDHLYASLRARPIPVRTVTSYGIVDYSMLRNVIFMSFYRPYAAFPILARALAELKVGNATGVYEMFEKPRFRCSCDADADDFLFENVIDGGVAVQCNDAERYSADFADFTRHYRNLLVKSGWADMWMQARRGCMTWPEFPKTNFRGPFVANTSFPLLLVGNTADPVTPLWAAKKMSKGFAGSVVLTQDSIGHGSPAAPSLCTQKHIRGYFRDGVLPEVGTVCSADGGPFDSAFPGEFDEGEQEQRQVVLMEDRDPSLLEAVRGLAEAWDVRFSLGL